MGDAAPTPQTPLEQRLQVTIDTGLAQLAATHQEQMAQLQAATAAYLAQQQAAKPFWKTSEFWKLAITWLTGLGFFIAKAAGAPPQHLEVAQQVVGGATHVFDQIASGADPMQTLVAGAMAIVPPVVYAVQRTKAKAGPGAP